MQKKSLVTFLFIIASFPVLAQPNLTSPFSQLWLLTVRPLYPWILGTVWFVYGLFNLKHVLSDTPDYTKYGGKLLVFLVIVAIFGVVTTYLLNQALT